MESLRTDAVPQDEKKEPCTRLPEVKTFPEFLKESTTVINEFITKISDKLEDDDYFKLKCLSRPFLNPKEKIDVKNPACLFETLKRKFATDSEFKMFVLELLNLIQRFDLLKMSGYCKHNFKSYDKSKWAGEKWNKWRDIYTVIESLDPDDIEGFKTKLLPLIMKMDDRKEQDQSLLGLQDLLGRDMVIKLQTEIQLADDHPYPMNNSPCGICLIINNEHFCDTRQMPDRHGTNRDRDELKRIFKLFNFEVETHDNKTSVEIIKVVNELAERDHSKYDCVICCILSHGEEGVVIGTDCKTVSILKQIVSVFHSREKTRLTLIGKPKLFFIQACQGTNRMNAVREPVESDSPSIPLDPPLMTNDDINSDGMISLPDTSDDLICTATYSGHLAYRSPTSGSWFVSTLVDQLEKFGDSKNLIEIMTLVNREVAIAEGEVNGHKVKQQPTQQSSLRRKLFFRKKK